VYRLAKVTAALLMGALATAALSASPLANQGAQDASAATRPLVGFSFSPRAASWLGEDPQAALPALLTQLSPDLVRLPVYWDSVEPARGRFDYSEVDRALATIRQYNLGHPTRPARVILEVGARNMGYPELYVPHWLPLALQSAAPLAVADPEYAAYLSASFTRYRHEPLLYSWQLENEPLDDVPTTAGSPADLPGEVLQEEFEAVKAIDPSHDVVVTTYNSSTLSLDLTALTPAASGIAGNPTPQPAGHPLESLQLGDALGLDVYVVTGQTSLADAGVRKRTDWKRAALDYWAEQSRTMQKPLWITEMQGTPWPGHTDFSTDDLLYSAHRYRGSAAGVVLLWGVESWLLSPAWMKAGVQAREVLGA
jgi:hypothetical protein